MLPTGLFGSLIAVVGLLIAAQPVAASTEPIVEHLEFNDSSMLSYADAIVANYSATTSATIEELSFPETTLTGGTIEINELFIRHFPGSGFADVFISQMIVGELDGCPSSMSTFGQTTVDPVVVDADGSATAVIDAAWTWTRQLNQAGVCFEKIVVERWTETYTIDLTFSDGATSAVVAYGNQVESLGSAPPPDQSGIPIPTESTLPAARVIPGDAAGEPASEFGDDQADTSPAGDEATAATNQVANAGDGSVTASDDGSLPLAALLVLVLIVVAAAGWVGYAMLRRFLKSNRSYEQLVAPIDAVVKPKPGYTDESLPAAAPWTQESSVTIETAAEETAAGFLDLASGVRSVPPSPPTATYTLKHGCQWVWAPKTVEVEIQRGALWNRRADTSVLHANHWYQGNAEDDGTWGIYDIRGEKLIGEEESVDVVRPYRAKGPPAT